MQAAVNSPMSHIRQVFWPCKPPMTEKRVPDLKDKVMIVTGSNTGMGKELAQILYGRNATVYMLARSEPKTMAAMATIRAAHPTSSGALHFIHLDLADLDHVKTSAATFLARESRLDMLFNNAGLGLLPGGSETKQGYELQLGVNDLGPFLLTRLLHPALEAAVASSPPNSVRIVWVSSNAAEGISPRLLAARIKDPATRDGRQAWGAAAGSSTMELYMLSKLGNYLHGAEYATRYPGIVSVSLNPGALGTDFYREKNALMVWFLRKTVLYPSVNGAYTALFAALSDEVTTGRPGQHVAPFGRLWTVSKEMTDAVKPEKEGGSGLARQFWEWSEEKVAAYL